MSTGVILYGPPASGKDTVTAALIALDPRFALFSRLKCGDGRTAGYRVVDRGTLDALVLADDIVWSNEQYGATYAVDRPELVNQLRQGTPVVHLGQVAAVDAVVAATPETSWLVVGLWCPRDVATDRLERRGSGDALRRLAVWDSTPPLPPPASTLNTGLIQPQDAAHLIAATVARLADAYAH